MSGDAMTRSVLSTNLPLPGRRSGKVRDIYDVTLADGQPGVLIVATDRISAFDVVMANGLPGKGVVLTQLSRFWFDRVASGKLGQGVNHHLLSTRAEDVPGLPAELHASVDRRMMLCRKTNVVPIECIARGYLAGSGLKEYERSGTVCGIPLPPGLRNGDRLPAPLFTPSTKAESGHDENISFEQAADLMGATLMTWLRDATLSLYRQAADYAATRGIVLADTKFEFGIPLDPSVSRPGPAGLAVEPILIDEIFTPDSSRFWPADRWQPGREQESFDKQFVRNYLETLVAAGSWDKTPPGPTLPEDVVAATLQRYREAYERLTGASIEL
jgi:phosphoribosylaminoimidazole-succinocarboxamide synthase